VIRSGWWIPSQILISRKGDRLLLVVQTWSGSKAPIDPEFGCVGEYACCHSNDLNPLLGMFCSKAPGDCVGREGGDPPYCEKILEGRFGNCTDNDIKNNRLLEGLGLGAGKKGALGLGVLGL
jgi:hypothetical protein